MHIAAWILLLPQLLGANAQPPPSPPANPVLPEVRAPDDARRPPDDVRRTADAAPALFRGFELRSVDRLDNGLRVIFVNTPPMPETVIRLAYRAGSTLDPPGRPGVAMVARAWMLESAGLQDEFDLLAETDYDTTTFELRGPPAKFAQQLATLARIAQAPPMQASELGEALATAMCATYEDIDRWEVRRRSVLALLFDEHPYRNPPEFLARSITETSADDVNELLTRWFVAGNATLLIFGRVEGDVASLVRKHFGGLRWAEPPTLALPDLPAPVDSLAGSCVARDCGVDLAWITPPLDYFENAAIDVLLAHLTHEIDGPLRRGLMEGLARTRRAGRDGEPRLSWERASWRIAGVLVLHIDFPAELAPGEVIGLADASGELVRLALSEAEKTPIDPIALNRATALARRRVLDERDSLRARVDALAAHELVGGGIIASTLDVARINRVGVADIQDAARRLRTGRRAALLRQMGDRGGPPPRWPHVTLSPPVPSPARNSRPPAAPGAAWPLTAALCTPLEVATAQGPLLIWSTEQPGREIVELRLHTQDSISSIRDKIARALWPDAPDRLTDYVTYHGLRIEAVARNATGPGALPYVKLSGPREELAQMLAIFEPVAHTPPIQGARPGLELYGDVSGDEMQAAARAALPSSN